MKNVYSVLTAVLMCLFGLSGRAQVVTTNPAVITPETKGVEITFHADWGNRGLMNLAAGQKVYAHTGVITNKSTAYNDWKYAPTWGDNAAKYELTKKSANEWVLNIPDIREYYGIKDANEEILRLAFVFRNGNNSLEGKTVNWGDIFVTVFPSVFPACKAEAFPGGGAPQMGATLNADGTVTFCLAATGKDDVLLVGSWNNYELTPAQQMNYTDVDGQRYFWLNMEGLEQGKDYIYYYLMDGQTAVGDPYARLVVTPDDKYIPEWVFPDMPAYDMLALPGVNAAVYNSAVNDYDWQVTDFKGVDQSDLIIYEMLLRDFTGTEGKAEGNGSLLSAIGKLAHIKALGVNAVELLPIMEFNGNQSWGYNTNFYFAPDKAYGTPEQYKLFIDRCHQMGIAVILDIVFNQADGQHPWWAMYPIQDNPHFNGSAPHAYSVLNDWNQGSVMVQKQFQDALKYWMTEYKVDGFRFDLVKGLGDNDSYGNTFNAALNTFGTPSDQKTNDYNATRVARMKTLHDAMRTVNPDAYFINENLATAREENEMAQDGEINWANINNAACQFAMGYESQSGLNRFYAPLDSRTWGSTVSYAESHDEERMAFKQAQYGAAGIKGNAAMSCRRLGSVAAQMILTPGAHMIWQFQEFGADQTTKNSSGNDTGNKRVIWSYLDRPANRGLCNSYSELCITRANNADMFREDVETEVKLDSWKTARTVKLVKGNKGLYLFVNPSPNTDMTTVTGLDLTASGFHLISASDGVTPTLTATTLTLPAGAYALYGTDTLAGVETVAPDDESPVCVTVDGNSIRVLGECASLEVYDMSGRRVGTDNLAPGVYIVRADRLTTKLAIQ